MYKRLDQAALDAILECGVDEFARCGFQPASVANVARAAGVSVGVIYKYFGDKQSLFLACVRHSLELLDATLREAVPEGADAETSIRALVPALIAAARQHGNYNVLYNEITSGSCREFAPELAREIESRTARLYTRLFETAKEAGVARAGIGAGGRRVFLRQSADDAPIFVFLRLLSAPDAALLRRTFRRAGCVDDGTADTLYTECDERR